MTAILALDPGKTTGVALWDEANGYQIETAELDFNATCDYVQRFVSTFGGQGILVSESFIINQNTPKNTQAPWSLELIGVSRYLSRRFLGRELELQSPASAKRFSSDARLRAIQFWTPAKGHANDAARHLLLHMATHGYFSQEIMGILVDTV